MLTLGKPTHCLIEVELRNGCGVPQEVLVEAVRGKVVIDTSFAKLDREMNKDGLRYYKTLVKIPPKTKTCEIRAKAFTYLHIEELASDEVVKTLMLATDSAPVSVKLEAK